MDFDLVFNKLLLTLRNIKLCDMEQQKVDMFMMANISNFQEDRALIIREKLLNESDDRWAMLSSAQFKSPTTALILSIFLGSIGVDRFYIGSIGMGIGKLITCGGCGIWTIVDWFLISRATREKNYEKLVSIL